MLEQEWMLVLLLGVVFVILGLVTILWGRREEKSYFEAISSRPDVREYLNHWPQRPEPGALKIGGWIALILGILLMAAGGLLYLLD